jgi:hypothetical protein
MSVQLKTKRTARQKRAWNALDDPTIRRVLYGGAKGGGKSYFLCVWLFTQVYSMMVEGRLEPSNNPPHVAWFGRKQSVDLTGTTLQTWREVIPQEYYTLKGSTEKDPKHILIMDRIAIDYGGLDKSENIQKFNSAEYVIICVDQAEEVTKDEVAVLRASLRMVLKGNDGKPVTPRDKNGKKIINPKTSLPYDHWPFKELYTANPRQCWLKPDFIDSPEADSTFVSALPSDNPYLPDDYVETLRKAFDHRPELLEAYLNGSWDMSEDADQIIKGRWLVGASNIAISQYQADRRRFLVCDVARFGDDETVIYYMEDTDIIEEYIYGQRDTMYTANRLHVLSVEHHICPIVVDEGGLGGGVVDRLREMDNIVYGVDSSRKSSFPEKYGNLRAEVWDNAAKMFSDGAVELHHGDTELRTQLQVPKYKYKNGKIYVEPKADIKKRMSRSPDRADAYINGLYYMRFIDKTSKGNKYVIEQPDNGRAVTVPSVLIG